jgi:hypothetical protein
MVIFEVDLLVSHKIEVSITVKTLSEKDPENA